MHHLVRYSQLSLPDRFAEHEARITKYLGIVEWHEYEKLTEIDWNKYILISS